MINARARIDNASWLAYAFVVSLFFVSGFSSLIYQVVWTRLLVFVFGSTTFASATVLAVFMGGLAAGSYLAGRFSARIKHPFLWYGILEGIIGLWAVIAPLLFDAAIPLYQTIWQAFHLSVFPFSLLRFAVAALILLPPTSCMGATLPLLSKFSVASLRNIGERIGTLYAINTLGAVGGAMTAGFLLLPALGLNTTTFLAVLSNILICVLVVWYHLRCRVSAETSVMADCEPKEYYAKEGLCRITVITIISFGISGAIAMVHEVAWTRTLLMVIGSSTYAFTIMLASFLLGIFLGSLIFAQFSDNLKEPLAWFAGTQLCLSLAGLFSVHMFNQLPYLNLVINASFPKDPSLALGVRFFLASLVLMPLSLFLGATFPLVVKVCTKNLEGVGRSVGMLYSANTFGAIIGAFLAGFALVPFLGAEKTLLFALVTNLVLGTVLLFVTRAIRLPIKVGACLAAMGVSAWALNGPQIFDRIVLMSAQPQRRNLSFQAGFSLTNFPSYGQWRDMLHNTTKQLFWQDGACSTVGVVLYPASGRHSLLTNGHIDASDGNDMGNQVLAAVYPVLFKPNAKSAAIIGWGSGVTVGTAALFPLATITAVELEPAVLAAAKFFKHVNLCPELNPNVHVELNDGRNYLLACSNKFDLIISEPSNPWQAGVCNLFTKEFFSICSKRLTKDGIFALWLQLAEIPTKDLLSVFSALKSVYPYTVPLQSEESNIVVLASKSPLVLDYAEASKLLNHPAIAKQLQRCNIFSFNDVLARIVASSEAINKITTGISANSDDLNQLEWDVSKTYENYLYAQDNKEFWEHNQGVPWQVVRWGFLTNQEKATLMSDVAVIAATLQRPLRALQWSYESLRIMKNPEALRAAGIAQIELGHLALGIKLLEEALSLNPHHIATLQTRGLLNLGQGNVEAAKCNFLAVLKQEPKNLAAAYHMAQAYYSQLLRSGNNNKQQATAAMLEYLGNLPYNPSFVSQHHDVLFLAGVAYQEVGKPEQAETCLKHFLRLEPRSFLGWRTLATVLTARGEVAESAICLQQAFSLRPRADKHAPGSSGDAQDALPAR